MAPKWTAERDQHLLLLIIGNTKIDFPDISRRWAEKFANEDFKPTPKAILEHVAKLKRDLKSEDGTAKKSFATPKSTTKATPSRSGTNVPKTPTGSSKRSRAAMSEEDDDDDDESKMDFDTPLPKRATPSRRSVTRKTYADPESSEDEENNAMEGANGAADDSDDGLEAAFDAVKASGKTPATMPPNSNGASNHSPSVRGDSVAGSEDPANGAKGKGKAAATRDYLAEDSDGSDFTPSI